MNTEKTKELLRKGGEWLAIARSYIQRNCIKGESVTWGSNDVLIDLSPKKLMEISALCAVPQSKNQIEETFEAMKNPQGPWADAAREWILETTGYTVKNADEDHEYFKPALTIAQAEEFAAHTTAHVTE